MVRSTGYALDVAEDTHIGEVGWGDIGCGGCVGYVG